MRLLRLDDHGGLSLTKHDDDKLPPYAILSHTWGNDNDEVTFQDVKNCLGKSKAGYAKLMFCGQQARVDDLQDFWVDSCCIKKDSDAELSESLNSMFRYYERAAKCYVYLENVSALKRDSTGQSGCNWQTAFRKSRWFTRGWTLQELLAPRVVEFWSRDGSLLGTKETLKNLIFEITGIPHRALCGAQLSSFTPEERFRWAAKRDTKRKEDKAYSLLGIFEVSMAPRYGEGADAFVRLERKIHKARNPAPSTSGFSAVNRSHDHQNATSPSRDRTAILLDRRQALLAFLGFEQLDARHSSIKEAQRSTCDWVMAHPDYVAWNSREKVLQQQEIMWIAGKPGAGKSTLMKFVLASAKQNKLEDETILSFFFNGRGDDLEKETCGMYRGLLLQLLTEVPDLQHILDDVGTTDRSNLQTLWTLEMLQKLLSNAVRNLGQRRVKCFIDALDECNEKQVQDMIAFLEDLGEDVLSEESRLSFCFASRHYPTLEIRNGFRLVLEDQAGHADDIRKYIHRRLRAGKSQSLDNIYERVQEKANGVFLWVALVVDILNEEYRRGRIFAVQRRLREIPIGLSDLFKDLLRRDCVNMDDLLLCLQWILFASRPLRREEFYFAMVAGLDHDHDHDEVGDWKPEPWDREEVTVEHMNRFILNASKGLAELTKSKIAPTVQFVHQSVRDFLIKDGGLSEVWPELDGKLASQSHDKLKNCCLRYMGAYLPDDVYFAQALPKAASSEARAVRQSISDQYPFLQYASKEVFHHANEAACAVGQKKFLDNLPVRRWIRVSNIYQSYDIRRHDQETDIVYVLAEGGYSRLVDTLRSKSIWRRHPKERYQFPCVAAFLNGHWTTLMTLLGDSNAASRDLVLQDPGFGKASSSMSPKQDLLRWAIEERNWGFVECLLSVRAAQGLSAIAATSISEFVGTHALAFAVAAGKVSMVQLLLENGAKVNRLSSEDTSPLGIASARGRKEMVQLLLDEGADANFARGRHGYKLPLLIAVEKGNTETVQVLLDKGADANISSPVDDPVLTIACERGYTRMVQMLLDHGAKINPPDSDCLTPLGTAADRGHVETMQLLLKRGAHVNPPGSQHVTPLFIVSATGNEQIVQLLILAGADVNGKVDLRVVAAQDRAGIATLLHDHGAYVNAGGTLYATALHAAYSHGHEGIVRQLLDAGAKVQSADVAIATAMGHGSIEKLLLNAFRASDANPSFAADANPVPAHHSIVHAIPPL